MIYSIICEPGSVSSNGTSISMVQEFYLATSKKPTIIVESSYTETVRETYIDFQVVLRRSNLPPDSVRPVLMVGDYNG